MDRSLFRRLLFRGHGRALLVLRRTSTDRYDDLIYEACVTDTRHDGSFEYGRASYVVEAAQSTPNAASIFGRVWPVLEASEPDRNQLHMLELASLCARQGSVGALRALQTVVERNCRTGLLEGAEELVKCTGQAGYRHLLSIIPIPSGEPQECFGYWCLHDEARKALGDDSADRVLSDLAATSDNVSAIAEAIQLEEEREAALEPNAGTPTPKYEALRDRLLEHPPHWYRTWGRLASPGCLVAAAMDLARATEDEAIQRLLNVFFARPYPLHPAKLIELARSGDRRLDHGAAVILAKVEHPDARAFALECLASRSTYRFGMLVLESNYRDGDAVLIAQALRRVRTLEGVHSLGLDVLGISKSRLLPELVGVLRTIYDRTPCEQCRGHAVEELHKLGALGPKLLDECLLDSSPVTREFAAKVKADGGSSNGR